MSLVLRETEVDNRLVWILVERTGLRFPTVRNLLVNGWTYEGGNWISPVSRLEEVR